MAEHQDRLRVLLEKYAGRTASEAEINELHTLIDTKDEVEITNLISEMMGTTEPEYDDARTERLLQEILKDKATPVVPMRRRWYQIAAAAVIILALGTGIYFLANNKTVKPGNEVATTEVKDIKAPASNRAMITLANGQTVYLDSANNGQLAVQGNVKLVKLANGSIAYENANGEITTTMQYNTLSNPRGSKVINMTLADGSKVWLNAGSSVTYPVAFIGNERQVKITGEAYFEVAHDANKPFKVGKGDMEVTVLGTHFNVNAYDDETDIKVTLLEGSVKVNNASRSSVVIKPGQQAIVNGDVRILSGADIDQVMAWKNGRFVFGDKADIQTIMRQIARWYDVDVEYKGNVTSYFGGSISRDANVSEVFKVLEATGNVRCKLEGRKVVVTP